MNKGVEGPNLGPQPTFVNETIMSEVRSIILQADKNSILTASVFIGNSNLVKEQISIEKSKASSLTLTITWSSSLTTDQLQPPNQTTR